MVIDIREVAGCTCLALRRVTRQVTQIYDRRLEPSGLTVNQFGVLAQLYGAYAAGRAALSIGMLSERLGMDPTTLNRSLKPLQAQNLVVTATDAEDRRVRSLTITSRGRAKVEQALPMWRAAKAELEEAVGKQAAVALSGFLNRSSAKLARRP